MKILFLGDLFYDYNTIKNDIISIGKYISKNNFITILNLEGPLLGDDSEQKKQYSLCNSKKIIDILKLLNVKAVNLANNHILDQGYTGLERLIDQLEKNSIMYFGAGKNYAQAIKPTFINI